MNIKGQDHGNGDEVAPILHWSSVAGGAVIATGVTVLGGLLWTAAAFSSHEGWAYDHLAWWIGGTIIVAAALGGVIAGTVSKARGLTAGVTNGATTGALLVAVAGTVALLALAVNGSTNELLVVGHQRVLVDFARPYVAFWVATLGLAASSAGGAVGGLVPRRYRGYPTVKLATVRDIDLTTDGNGRAHQPQHAAAS
jgi:hypothetical protein